MNSELKHPVLRPIYLPTNPIHSIWHGFILWLLMDRFSAPSWLYGVFFTLWGIVFVTRWYAFFQEEQTDPVFKNTKD